MRVSYRRYRVRLRTMVRGLRYSVPRLLTVVLEVRRINFGLRRLTEYAYRLGLVTTIEVDVDELLLGDQAGQSASRFFRTMGKPGAPSVRLSDSAYVGGPIGPRYSEIGREALRVDNHFFGVTEPELLPTEPRMTSTSSSSRGRSTGALPAIVRPVWNSQYFQIVDGHHRLARAIQEGATRARVIRERVPVLTPAQDALLRMSWMEGRPVLYQPVPFVEVAHWPTVRQCTDRWSLICEFLESRSDVLLGAEWLDIACNYGWFVAAARERGFRARGFDLDPNCQGISEMAYGLDAGEVECSSLERWLASGQSADIVSCFSILHHVIISSGEAAATRLLASIWSRARLGMFFDMGQDHETWIAGSLQGWDEDRVASWLRGHCAGSEVQLLGRDRDGCGSYAGQYGRGLFAVWRMSGRR